MKKTFISIIIATIIVSLSITAQAKIIPMVKISQATYKNGILKLSTKVNEKRWEHFEYDVEKYQVAMKEKTKTGYIISVQKRDEHEKVHIQKLNPDLPVIEQLFVIDRDIYLKLIEIDEKMK